MIKQSDPDAAKELFVFPKLLGTKQIAQDLHRLSLGLPAEFVQLTQTLDVNLRRMKTTAGIPFTLSWLAETKLIQERLRNSAKFKAVDLHDPQEDDFGEKVEVAAEEILEKEFSAILNSAHGASAIDAGAARHLIWFTTFQKGELKSAANDLLLQSVIALWGAYEAFNSDVVRCLLNREPAYLKALTSNEETKRRFGKIKWSLPELLDVGLDLSSKVGDLLLQENDLSDYASIKVTLEALFPGDEPLRQSLSDPRLRVLSKSRNLLAHRGGLVDAKFQKETGLSVVPGEILSVSPTSLCEYLEAVGNAATSLLASLRKAHKLG